MLRVVLHCALLLYLSGLQLDPGIFNATASQLALAIASFRPGIITMGDYGGNSEASRDAANPVMIIGSGTEL